MFFTTLLRTFLNRSFKPFIFSADNPSVALNLECKNTGLYIHIPFCQTICQFCPYNKVLYNQIIMQNFKEALLMEIEYVGNLLKTKPFQTISLYYGGGSPALMAKDLVEINNKLKEYFILGEHRGIELHPDDINPDIISLISLADFNMISIGVQSFDKNVLESLGRKDIDIIKKLESLSDYNFRTIDIDLIFGFEGHSTKILVEDFKKAVDNGATQISTYPFIDFSFKTNSTKPLSNYKRKKMLEQLVKTSEEMGFERTSIWTFAKKNTPKYSSVTRDNFIGFGPSATTLLKDVFNINTFNVEEYINIINENKLPTALTHHFTQRSRAVYWLFWCCYNMSIDSENFNLLFDYQLNNTLKTELKIAEHLGLLKHSNNIYKLTDRGAYLFHLIEQAYTHQYINKTWDIMSKDPWPESITLY